MKLTRDEFTPLNLPAFHGAPVESPDPPSCYDEIEIELDPDPDPTDDGLGCSDGGAWDDADPDLWAFGACVVLALLVAGAVWMLAAG